MWAYGMEQKTLDGKQELIKYLLWCISWKISSIGYGIMLMSPRLSVPHWLRGQLGVLFSGLRLQGRLGKLFTCAAQARGTEQGGSSIHPSFLQDAHSRTMCTLGPITVTSEYISIYIDMNKNKTSLNSCFIYIFLWC